VREGNSLRVVIVDDEPLARDCMRLALQKAPNVSVVAECADGVSAVEAIASNTPDVVFLDVQMPGLDGFAVIDRVGPESMPAVVFVTAFDAHAIRAFEVHALDYVLKPFNDNRLLAALERARSAAEDRRHGELGRRLADLVRTWEHPVPEGAELAGVRAVPDDQAARRQGGAYNPRFAVRENGRVRFIAATDVDYIEADRNYMVVHVGETAHRIRASLRDVIAELDPKRFVRIHRSAIVNVERVREVQPWFGGDYIAILRTGAKLRVSRRRAAELLRPIA
jgi:two-component system LytT family response regulator